MLNCHSWEIVILKHEDSGTWHLFWNPGEENRKSASELNTSKSLCSWSLTKARDLQSWTAATQGCQSLLEEEGLTCREERGELQHLLVHRNSVKSLKAAFTNSCPRSTVTRGPRPLGTGYCVSCVDYELVQPRGIKLEIHWINNQKEPWLLDHTALKPRGGNQTTGSSHHCHSVGVPHPTCTALPGATRNLTG